MKLKELPVSLFQEYFLKTISLAKLYEGKEILPIIVTLTTIIPRIKKVHLVIRSILNQKQIPEKIVLNLNEGLRSEIPKSLEKLIGERFEIHFSGMDCPHMKLIPTLERFPNHTIITCDDDLLYQKNWLYLLYKEHQKHPQKIITNQSRIISYNENEVLMPYAKWPTNYDASITSKKLLPIGSSGTLYPSKSLASEVFNENSFLKLAPKADDLWFKAMSLLNKAESRQSALLTHEPIPIIGSQKVSLKKQNIGEDKNRTQWLALEKNYNLQIG